MIDEGNDICPICSGPLRYYDTVKRLVRGSKGKKKWIEINRFICQDCKSTHRELPNYILPYKHYEKRIIEGFINHKLSSCELEFEDYPSESIINEWIRTQNKHPFL